MKPTPGRIVNFKDHNGKLWAALISDINKDNTVSLWVFYRDEIKPYLAIKQGQDSMQWDWPKYN
ncbi:MAG TPA: hypothetical protein VK190_04765 [Pseudoneobacillus sp.]|nr:hypothetical protein [Pseudoneobacillus sp.]